MGEQDKNTALFGECKWTNETVDLGVLKTLAERSQMFHYHKTHLYLFAKNGFTNAVMGTYLESGDDSEEYILKIMNSADYRPDSWNPLSMKRSALGIGYLGCNNVDVQSVLYHKWHNYSNFKEWFRQNNIEGRKFDLDKDLLTQGNTVYGSDTCALIIYYANMIFEDRGIKTNIVQDPHTRLFDTSMYISGKKKVIGSFESVEETQRELLAFKKQFIIKYVKKNRNKVSNKVYEAMIK